MKNDQIVADVRKVREAHAKSLGFDIKAIANNIKAGEKRLSSMGWKTISRKNTKMQKLN